MRKFISVLGVYLLLSVIIWILFGIANANFNAFIWCFEARKGYSVIMFLIMVLIIIIYPAIDEW